MPTLQRDEMRDRAFKRPAVRADLFSVCMDRATLFETAILWPALAATWRADAEFIRALGVAPRKRRRLPVAPADLPADEIALGGQNASAGTVVPSGSRSAGIGLVDEEAGTAQAGAAFGR